MGFSSMDSCRQLHKSDGSACSGIGFSLHHGNIKNYVFYISMKFVTQIYHFHFLTQLFMGQV